MKFIIGKKLEMTQIFREDGRAIPVTAVLATPNVVTQIKGDDDNYSAVQVGFGPAQKIKKAKAGHLKGIGQIKTMREFKVRPEEIKDLKRGDEITVNVFEVGDKIKVVGTSKGKGFQGVVRRHGFHGAPASHGHKDQERMPGSIGATDAARVFKGKKMPGQMGNARSTVSGLEIIEVDSVKNILYIKGAVPGARNGLLLVGGPGEMELTNANDANKKDANIANNTDKEVKEENIETKKNEKKETLKQEEKNN